MTTEHAESAVPRPLEHLVWVCAIGLSDDSESVRRSGVHRSLERWLTQSPSNA